MKISMELSLKVPALLLLGPTGSGKTPLGRYIENRGLWKKECFHFDFGHCLREANEKEFSLFSEKERKKIRNSLENGALLENKDFSIVEKIFFRFRERREIDSGSLVVLNGMPRHIGQAEDMKRLADIRLICVLNADPEVIISRIRENTGGDRLNRTDDDREFILRKMEIYQKRTRPLIDYYRKRKIPVLSVSVEEKTLPSDILPVLESREEGTAVGLL